MFPKHTNGHDPIADDFHVSEGKDQVVEMTIRESTAPDIEGTRLDRGLKPRHLTMISMGGVLGTGLFLYSGDALAAGGPAGLLLGFGLVGSVCWAVMIGLGEMVAFDPLPGGPITLAARYVDESLSFVLGWYYWYTWAIFLPSELAAVAALIHLWNTSVNDSVWILLFLITALVINFFGSKAYGETEFWLSTTKVLLIIGLIFTLLIIDCGGVPGTSPIGFRYWHHPGPFVQYLGVAGVTGRFLGFWATLTRAAYSYIGTEIVAIAAGEARNPRTSIPRAIKSVYIRLLLFYIGGVFVIGLCVASDDKRLSLNSGTSLASPFVIATQNAGIKVLPAIINGGLLVSGLSAASSELFTCSRALHGLALGGHAPRILSRTTKRGVPLIAIMCSFCMGLLAFMSLGTSAGKAFGYLASLGAASGLLMWWGICLMFIRFEKGLRVQGISRSSLPYSHSFNRRAWSAKYAFCFITVVLLFTGFANFINGNWNTANFITSYLPTICFPFLYFGHKFIKKTKIVTYAEMNLSAAELPERIVDVEHDVEIHPKSRFDVRKLWAVLG